MTGASGLVAALHLTDAHNSQQEPDSSDEEGMDEERGRLGPGNKAHINRRQFGRHILKKQTLADVS